MALRDRVIEVLESYKKQLGYLSPTETEVEEARVDALIVRMRRADITETTIERVKRVHRSRPEDY